MQYFPTPPFVEHESTGSFATLDFADTAVTGVARSLAAAFRNQGHDLYLVGGAVRDIFLGYPVSELDFATSARPALTATIIAPFLASSPYRVGEKFGTVGGHIDGVAIEITTFRSAETYTIDSRKPAVEFGASILDDLRRRDFTINAIAIDPYQGVPIDPFDGINDLRRGIVRAVGDPRARFEEDPLRILRGVRFAATLKFALDVPTRRALVSASPRLTTISRERIREEYEKILVSAKATRGLTLLRDLELFSPSVPQLGALNAMPDHGPHHPLSLWDHTMRVVDSVPPAALVRWAALLHDIAKPVTRSIELDGRIRFFHHDEKGADMAREVLSGLRYSHAFADKVALLVASHMQIHAYSDDWRDGAVRRLILRLNDLLPDAIVLARADAAGHTTDGRAINSPKFEALEQRLTALGENAVQALKSPLSGEELMQRFGRPPGPWIQAIKDALLDRVLDGQLDQHDKATAWSIADEIVQGSG
ncbi:MAG: CCA tRNA nucleotidyltransferase [Chloroflexota bacterium]